MFLSFSILKPNLGKSPVCRESKLSKWDELKSKFRSPGVGLGSPVLPGINISKSFSLYQSLGTYKTCLDFQGRG